MLDDTGLHELALPEPPIVAPISSSRVGRPHKKPKRLNDFLPSSATPIPIHMRQPIARPVPPRDLSPPQSPEHTPPPESRGETPVQTEPNEYGLYRVYPVAPSYDPEEDVSLDHVCDSQSLTVSASASANPLSGFGIPSLIEIPEKSDDTPFYAPFLNRSIFYLMSWFYNGSEMKSVAELDRLVDEVLMKQDFKLEELKGFKATSETKRMDDSQARKEGNFAGFDGWTEATVQIRLPAGDSKKGGKEETAPLFNVPGVWHRDLIEVITSAWQEDTTLDFHIKPYQQFFKRSPDTPPERVYGEAYTSDVFLQMDADVRALPTEPGCTLERVAVPIMLWSDSTHLANFGNASMWPVYMQFANQSKYTRAKPTAFASHHLAYLPSVQCFIIIQTTAPC